MDCGVSATLAFLLQDKGRHNSLQTPRVSVFPICGFTEALTQCKGSVIMSVFLFLDDIIPLKLSMQRLVMLFINKPLVCKFST